MRRRGRRRGQPDDPANLLDDGDQRVADGDLSFDLQRGCEPELFDPVRLGPGQDHARDQWAPLKVQLVNAGGTNLSSSMIIVSLVTPAVVPNPGTAPQPTGAFAFMSTGDPVTHTVEFVIR